MYMSKQNFHNLIADKSIMICRFFKHGIFVVGKVDSKGKAMLLHTNKEQYSTDYSIKNIACKIDSNITLFCNITSKNFNLYHHLF